MADLNVLQGDVRGPEINAQHEWWLRLHNQDPNARLYMKAVDGPVEVTVESGPDLDPTTLATSTTVTIDQAKVVKNTPLPVGGDLGHYYTRVRANGKVRLQAVAQGPTTNWERLRPEGT